MVTVFGNEVEVKVGSVVRFDEAPFGRQLGPGMERVDDCFPGSDFTLRGNWQDTPVNVRVTGRTAKRWGGELWVRCEVEFVRDGEPNEFGKAWLLV